MIYDLLIWMNLTHCSYYLRRHNSYDILYDENVVTRGYDDVELTRHLRNDGKNE